MSKSQIMAQVISGRAHEAFTHEHYGTFDVTLMRKAARNNRYGPPAKVKLYPEIEHIIRYLKQYRDWEPERVWQVMVNEAFASDPVLMIEHGDGDYTLIDGIHRLFARWILREPYFLAYIIPMSQAIRPSPAMFFPEWGDQWGRMRVNDKGEIIDKDTGQVIKGGPKGGRVR